jgi:N-acyl homoserine lactone hydrolase
MRVGGEGARIGDLYPSDTSGVAIEIPYFVYLIQHPRGNVLFDTGVHPAMVRDPQSRLGTGADPYDIRLREGDDPVSQLARIGVAASEIEHLVMSHLHYDHAGGIERFADATVYVQREELGFARSAGATPGLYFRDDFGGDVRFAQIAGEHDLFGDGSVVCIPTPGHSPGHQSLLVRLGGQTIFLLADATYLIDRMRGRIFPSNVWNADAMVASWERIETIERHEGAELVCTHALDFAESVPLAPDRWYE